jgi:hypothetical protein
MPQKRSEKKGKFQNCVDPFCTQKPAASFCFPLTNTLKQPMEKRTGPNHQRQGHLEPKSEQKWAQRPKISKLSSFFGALKAVTRLSFPLTSTFKQSMEALTARNHQGEGDLELVDGRRSKQFQKPVGSSIPLEEKAPSYSKMSPRISFRVDLAHKSHGCECSSRLTFGCLNVT